VSLFPRGLYEILVTEAVEASLADLGAGLEAKRGELRAAEAGDRIALHLGRIVRRVLEGFDDKDRVQRGMTLSRSLIDVIGAATAKFDVGSERPVDPGQLLSAIVGRNPDGLAEALPQPLIPLLDTTLLTNSPGEPRVGSQLLAEIGSADRIDLVMAFVRMSGVRPLLDSLRRFCETGRDFRILTTTYTGSTESRALDAILAAGGSIRISYDTSSTRLHAKAWLFHRASGFSTAYIGSSNLTHSAQSSGLEWNVRVSGARNPDVIEKVAAVFDGYWNGGDFVVYDAEEFAARSEEAAPSGPRIFLSPIEVRLEPFQERLLEQVALARENGRHKNLLVSATGTGKTVMAGVDYSRLRGSLPRARLLFVAHRKEILAQSLATFRHCLREPSFGELWVGGTKPKRFGHVFASIQSLSASDLSDLHPEHFDVVIVDEFHHAAAGSYLELLRHVRPRELLGLTATPERSDGLPILDWFQGRVAAELRLWDAIDQHRLVPFAYYGIHDGLDLRDIPWKRGRGYDVDGLSNLLTGNESWARGVIKSFAEKVDDPRSSRTLGFCVSIDHARFMARVFQSAGLPSVAIWADSPADERHAALADLDAGRISVLFSVDLFNEGVDLPRVDTLLFLRPTDSPTLFLQQLGRGLRKAPGKSICTVLDFVGRHRVEFRFDRRFRALLGGSRKELEHQIEGGFPFLPAGCHMELDRVASEIVLANIRTAVPSRWAAKIEELRSLARGRPEVDLGSFLSEAGLDLEDVYSGGKSWSDLREAAGLPVALSGPWEKDLRKACGRLLHVDDLDRIENWQAWLKSDAPPDLTRLSVRQYRLLRMLVTSLCRSALERTTSMEEGVTFLWGHPQVRSEVAELLGLLRSRISHLHPVLALPADIPLRIHSRYTRDEILASVGAGSVAVPPPWREGVYWAREPKLDLFVFTVDKTSGQFSPTTRYRDYALSPDLIHWESQSTTRAESPTGIRYQGVGCPEGGFFLFARMRTDDRAFWFLGPAAYVRHEGELPMAITWRLKTPLPGDLFASLAVVA